MINARRDCKCNYCVNYFLDKPSRAEAPPPADSPAIASLRSAVDDLRSVGVDVEPIVPGGPTVSAIDALKSQCAAVGKLLDGERQKREEAEKALADRIASEPGRFNAVMGVWQKSKQQVEAQRDMIREQRDNALADLAALKANAPLPPVGAIVTVKSGGPRMTIAEDQGGRAMCIWWAGQFFATDLFEYAGLVTLPN